MAKKLKIQYLWELLKANIWYLTQRLNQKHGNTSLSRLMQRSWSSMLWFLMIILQVLILLLHPTFNFGDMSLLQKIKYNLVLKASPKRFSLGSCNIADLLRLKSKNTASTIDKFRINFGWVLPHLIFCHFPHFLSVWRWKLI